MPHYCSGCRSSTDDIPIQGPNKEENGGLQHLSSINEESEGGAPSVSESGQKVSAGGGGGGGTATATTGKPKDSTKHKVLGGFKKLKPEKEKDKDKDKDREKEKDGNALVSLGGPALANSTGGGTSLSGSSLVEEAKALMSATKKINSKEKLSGK